MHWHSFSDVLPADSQTRNRVAIAGDAAIEIQPTENWHLVNIAENHLEQGVSIERALEFVAVAKSRKQQIIATNKLLWASILINQAWGLTLLDQPDGI